MIPFQEAQRLLSAKARDFGYRQVPLENAYGLVLAENLYADRDYPPFNRSAMDGFAIRHRDLSDGLREFRVIGTLYAGMECKDPPGAGQCVRIMTGAPVPEPADLVVRKEDVMEQDGVVRVGEGSFRPYLNISRRGEDLRAGEQIGFGPRRCDAATMSLLATIGRTNVRVASDPTTILMTTGDEVVDPDKPIGSAQIRNSNRWLIQSLLQSRGIRLADAIHSADDRRMLKSAVERALVSADLILLTGGVSSGDADHVPDILRECGVQMLFHKLSIRPGKPVWCGISSGGAMVFALPGNPLSCLTGYMLLVDPWLDACCGLQGLSTMTLPLRAAHKKRTTLDEFFPVRLCSHPAGVEPVAFNGSGDIRLGLNAHALALHPSDAGDLEPGTEIRYFPFWRPF